MSLVFQNIDHPPTPSPPGEWSVYPCLCWGGGRGRTHSPGGEEGGGSIFWKTRDIGLPSFSNNLYVVYSLSQYDVMVCCIVPCTRPLIETEMAEKSSWD